MSIFLSKNNLYSKKTSSIYIDGKTPVYFSEVDFSLGENNFIEFYMEIYGADTAWGSLEEKTA